MDVKYRIKNFLLLYVAFFIYSISSVCAKIASSQATFAMFVAFFCLEVLFLGIYAVLWQKILMKIPLVVAMSNKGITVIFSILWSILVFHETITIFNIVGAILVMVGVVLVSKDE